MSPLGHALVFWMAGTLFGTLLGWTLTRRARGPGDPEAEESRAVARPRERAGPT